MARALTRIGELCTAAGAGRQTSAATLPHPSVTIRLHHSSDKLKYFNGIKNCLNIRQICETQTPLDLRVGAPSFSTELSPAFVDRLALYRRSHDDSAG